MNKDALTLLRWLAYAARPMTLAELQTVVTIRPEDGEVDFEDEGDFRDSLDILAGLVVFSDGANSTEDGEYTEYYNARMETRELTLSRPLALATQMSWQYSSTQELMSTHRIAARC
jgi:hypothetical protein